MDMGIDANPLSFRQHKIGHDARRGEKLIGIFGIDTTFERMSVADNICLPQVQRLTLRRLDLGLNDVDAARHFRDGMFDLQARIHLDEIELAVFKQEFESSHPAIADLSASLDASHTNRLDHIDRNSRRWRFFDHFLMTTLHRTVAVTKPDGIAVRVAQDLYLDMTGMLEKLLHVEDSRAKSLPCLLPRQGNGFMKQGSFLHHPHATPATTARSLDDDWIADLIRDTLNRCSILGKRCIRSRYTWHTGRNHCPFGSDLVAHRGDRPCVGTDEYETGIFDSLRKGGIFGQKSITRMDRTRTRQTGSD